MVRAANVAPATLSEKSLALGETVERDVRFALRKPCAACPYSRTTTPGSLGGSDPSVYVGQSLGPFWLPCHCSTDYSDPEWKQDTSKPQCAGAAMFRDAIGVAGLMPPALHRLKADTSLVFSSHAELLAYHRQIPLEEAQKQLRMAPPELLLELEMLKLNQKGWVKVASR